MVTVQRTILGDMKSSSTCPSCHGTGTKIEDACPECEGQGRVPDRQKVSVEVPAGIRDGQQMRVSGFGEAGMQGAAAGDLIVTIRIQPHEFYERDGDDLHVASPFPWCKLRWGLKSRSKASSRTRIPVRIPEGTQNGQVIRVRDYGMPRLRSDAAATCTFISTL